MKLLIDDARIEPIRELAAVYPAAGVTTNPTILARAGLPPYESLRLIRACIGPEAELHVQVVAREAEGMLRDAERILSELGEGTYIKVPCVPEGFKAMRQMHARGVRVTGTAVLSPMQALLAANCGAAYVAPYVNRMDCMGIDGVNVVRRIQRIFDIQGMETQVLGASFKNTEQVVTLAELGVAAATVPADLFAAFVSNPAIDAAVDAFTASFESLVGAGKTMADGSDSDL